MLRLYPRSFPGLLLVGFILVALPLLIALITNAITVDRLADRSQNAVYQAAQATQSSRRLAQLVTGLERTARQIAILDDASLLDAYAANRRRFGEAIAAFRGLPLEPDQAAVLDRIEQGEAGIHAVLTGESPRKLRNRDIVRRFDDLAAEVRAITTLSSAQIDREIESMRTTATQARRITVWQLLTLVPVAIFLVIGFAILINRPVRQLDAAIRRLGAGEFHTPVTISAPQDLEHLGERLESMRLALVDLEEQKNRFLRQVSHELKTPLTALREGADLLAEGVVGQLAPGQREVAEILRHKSVELQRLIENLLAFGASQFRKANGSMGEVDIRTIVDRVVSDQSLPARARRVVLEVDVESTPLIADAEKLRVTIDNLVSNAIRHSPGGSVVRVAARRSGSDLQVDVIDHGCGIRPEEKARIFEPFYRGQETGAGAVGGTGIGLSIVKEYVAAHHGTVSLVDADIGAHLRVRIPLNGPGTR